MPNYISKYEIYLDFETTGIYEDSNNKPWAVNPALAEIVQIGCIAYKSGKKHLHLDAICCPPCLNSYQSPESLKLACDVINTTTYTVNGIHTSQMLKSCSEEKALKQLIHNLKMFCLSCKEKPTIIGHNILNFDIPLLYHRMIRYGYSKDEVEHFLSGFQYVDTLYQHKLNSTLVENKTLEFMMHKRLEDITAYLNYNHDAHDATNDCYASRYLLYAENAKDITSIDVFQSKHRHREILKNWKTKPIKFFDYSQMMPATCVKDLNDKVVTYGKFIGENCKFVYNNYKDYFNQCLADNLRYHITATEELKLKYVNEIKSEQSA